MILVAALATACGGGGGKEDVGAPSTTSAGPATTTAPPSAGGGTTIPLTALTLHVTDVRLLNSEEADNAMRVILPAGVASASVTLTGVPTPNRIISVCQANSLDQRMSTAACRMPANGEAVTVALGSAASGVEIVQTGVSGAGGAGNTTALDDVAIRYSATSREVKARLAEIAAGEAGGHPAFALTPAGTGSSYSAQLTWSVIQVFGGTPTNAMLEVLQGGTVVKHVEGTGLDVRLSGDLPAAGGDVTVRVQNIGTSAMVGPKLTLQLP